MKHRFTPPLPRLRHLWLPSGSAARPQPRAAGGGPPPVETGQMTSFEWTLEIVGVISPTSGFSPTSISGWSLAFDARNPTSFGGSFPSNGASVTSTTALYAATRTLAQHLGAPVPTFAVDAMGANRHALRFSRATGTRLVSTSAPLDFWSSTCSVTIFLVVRWAPGSVALGTQWIGGVCQPGGTTNSSHNQLASISQATGHIMRANGATTSGDIPVGSAPPEGQNLLILLRRNHAAPTGQRFYGLRDGTVDAPAGPGGLDTLSSAAAAANMVFSLGQRGYNNAWDLSLDADIGACFMYPGVLPTNQEDGMKGWLKSAFAIA